MKVRFGFICLALLASPATSKASPASLDGAGFSGNITLPDGSLAAGYRFLIKGQKGTYETWGYDRRDHQTHKCTLIGLRCEFLRRPDLVQTMVISPDGSKATVESRWMWKPELNADDPVLTRFK